MRSTFELLLRPRHPLGGLRHNAKRRRCQETGPGACREEARSVRQHCSKNYIGLRVGGYHKRRRGGSDDDQN